MVDSNKLNRRGFIHLASAALVVPIGGLVSLQPACMKSVLRAYTTDDKNAAAPWQIRITSDDEPGQPLIVAGTIFDRDGRTPLEGIKLWVYQTDATGNYTTRGGDNRNTRLHGVMRTSAEGKYEFRTIKPGSYPGGTNPAHIHAYVSGPGYPEYWIDEYLFDDDPLVTSEIRRKSSDAGSFSPILKTTRGNDGILRAVRNITIERCSRNCTGR